MTAATTPTITAAPPQAGFDGLPPLFQVLMVIAVLYVIATASWRLLLFLLALEYEVHVHSEQAAAAPVHRGPGGLPPPCAGCRAWSAGNTPPPGFRNVRAYAELMGEPPISLRGATVIHE
eukprot:gnl/TRDRNA2_/TRDRNA2_190076_c0_seq1.p2 gnl/TRDRNA2_/TRDRNA2_190076_c0~~gnl/TRDRNA2_/TRDRNA2_190076_c0_seq1.p2  ORF type:complete len:120 (+),score=19.17 gnl/TRDRNA2_/TRDRNA2_190076_c0_seq1:47-406(+)